MNIGIIGMGVVGTAQSDLLNFIGHNVLCNDIKPGQWQSIESIKHKCSAIFLCLPTEQSEDGSINMSAYDNVMPQLEGYNGIVIVKSTVLPGTTQALSEKYSLNMCHNPEFLTEKNAKFDAMLCDRIIIGHTLSTMTDSNVVHIYKPLLDANPKIKLIITNARNSEMCKYANNLFLAMKVSFANELKRICDNVNVDYDIIKYSLQHDTRIGPTHFDVSKKGGYGGMCFPKDTSAFKKFCEDNDYAFEMLEATIDVNKLIRPEYY